MSHVKAGGTAKNVHDSPGQRLGLKRFGGQKVNEGEILVRQVGQTKLAGPGTFMSRDFTIHAAKDGGCRSPRQVRSDHALDPFRPVTGAPLDGTVAASCEDPEPHHPSAARRATTWPLHRSVAGNSRSATLRASETSSSHCLEGCRNT